MRLSPRTLIAVCLLLAMSLAGFAVARFAVRADIDADRDRRAQVAATALATAVADIAAGPRTAVGLFATAGSPERFAQAAAPGVRNPAVLALAWAPRVPEDLRAAFERGRGIAVTQPGPDGAPVPAAAREHLPLTYLAPGRGTTGTPLTGLDIAGVPGGADALAAAAAGASGTVTAPFRLRGPGTAVLFLEAALPEGAGGDPAARRAALTGAVASVVDPARLVADALPDAGAVRVSDGGRTLARTGGDLTGAVTRRLAVGGRTWRVEVASPAPAGAAWLPWVVLAAGLAVTALVGMLLEQRTRALRVALRESRDLNAELDAARALAERRSRIDALTGLFTRGHLMHQLEGELQRDGGRRAGLVLVDLLGLGEVNRSLGHAAGDRLLVEVAGRLRGTLRDYDCVARWDAGRFALLVPQVPDDAALWRVAESLRRVLTGAPVPLDGGELWVGCAVGCAPSAGRDPDGVLEDAELAVARARAAGGGRAYLHGEVAADLARQPDALRIAEALARTAGRREGMPEGHCPQVADLAAATAERLGLPAAVVLRCRLAGWLHDLGKVAIPAALLTKPGPLDEHEWVVMRTHSELGERMLAGMPGLAEVAPAVRHHHERWDGGGYPDGLDGQRIPVEARIVAAADAYSAITSAPPFHAPRDPQEALAELRRCAGTQLDPAVAEALCAIVAERLAAGAAA
jgi:diguanylate cyclase (GGDEF)-like protein